MALLVLLPACERPATERDSVGQTSQPVAASPQPMAAPTVDKAAEKARFERDRSALRAKHPATEAEVTKLFGRQPDNTLDTADTAFVQWFYQTKDDSRDVIQIAVKGGKIIIWN
jgi:hypothetical protein